jgi:hypothetical protein
VTTRDDDAAWREIVDHYGDAPVVPDEPPAEPPAPTSPAASSTPSTPSPPEPFFIELHDDGFVPPPLPPPPEIATDRRFAWVGLVAPPLLFIVVSLLDYPLPGVIDAVLVLAFLGSFGYLVATMSREPRDPDDDGARL